MHGETKYIRLYRQPEPEPRHSRLRVETRLWEILHLPKRQVPCKQGLSFYRLRSGQRSALHVLAVGGLYSDFQTYHSVS